MLVTVGQYYDPWEAHVLRARLEAEGIPASISGDQHMIAHWAVSFALGGALLQVPRAFAEQALEVIADYHSGQLEQDLIESQPEAEDVCPACGSTDIAGSIPFGQRALNVLTVLVAGAPFPAKASSMQCAACGHQWRYAD